MYLQTFLFSDVVLLFYFIILFFFYKHYITYHSFEFSILLVQKVLINFSACCGVQAAVGLGGGITVWGMFSHFSPIGPLNTNGNVHETT